MEVRTMALSNGKHWEMDYLASFMQGFAGAGLGSLLAQYGKVLDTQALLLALASGMVFGLILAGFRFLERKQVEN